MDLNRKYSDHQQEVLLASEALDDAGRKHHLGLATDIAGQIATYQTRMGAAAACAWSAAHRKGSVSVTRHTA
jgi:hypothetical protein